jgi:predicted nucleotidyltransferase
MRKSAKRLTVQESIDLLVQRIVKKFHPEQIILFGSQARGDAGPDSDIDLLVVMNFQGRKLDTMVELQGDRTFPAPARGHPGHDAGGLCVAEECCRHD